jgi:hypothetical protein
MGVYQGLVVFLERTNQHTSSYANPSPSSQVHKLHTLTLSHSVAMSGKWVNEQLIDLLYIKIWQDYKWTAFHTRKHRHGHWAPLWIRPGRTPRQQINTVKQSKSYSSNRPWRPTGLLDVKDPTLSRQSASRWGRVLSYVSAALYSPETLLFCFWYSFLLKAEQTPGARGRIRLIEKMHSHWVWNSQPSGL